MNRKEEIDARIETLQEELEKLKKQRERLEIPVTERIKTFTDAVEELGSEHPLVKQYMAANGNESFTRNTIAYMKLLIIAAALNAGWRPQFTEYEYRWFPWFTHWTEGELKDKSEEWKANNKLVLFGGLSTIGARCGLAFANSHAAWANAASDISARLAVKSEEISDYFGNQFIDIWEEYLLDGCETEKHDTDVCTSFVRF